MNLYNYRLNTKIGILEFTYCDKGLHKINFENQLTVETVKKVEENKKNFELNSKKNRILELILDEFNDYFNGNQNKFTVPLILNGSDFFCKCWRAFQNIPFGKTQTYQEIASKIGNFNAARAVGNAANRNPLPIVIPCHRIIGKNGKLTGFAGEIWRKEWLLNHEKSHLNIKN